MEHHHPTPDIWRLFRIWAGIGLQSFGGGASTTFLIRRAFTDKGGWITAEEMQQLWNLCVFTPGINLVALCILIGKRLGGATGVVLSLIGFLVPSATITCLLTAGFTVVESIPAIQAMLRGVVPATGGVMLLVGLGFARPLAITTYKEGRVKLLLSAAVVAGCFVAIVVFKIAVVFVVLGAALLGILFFTPRRLAIPLEETKGEDHD